MEGKGFLLEDNLRHWFHNALSIDLGFITEVLELLEVVFIFQEGIVHYILVAFQNVLLSVREIVEAHCKRSGLASAGN
jgi:hypothetical protein